MRIQPEKALLVVLLTTGPVKLGSLLRTGKFFRGEELSDKHITGCNKILQHQFHICQKPEQMKPAEENSTFFHHYNQHWAVSQLRDDTVYLYDTMQPNVIYQQLREQLLCLYGGKRIIRLPPVKA